LLAYEPNGIIDVDVWNFDEIGFQMGVAATAGVVTQSEKQGRVKTKQPGNREWVTVVHGINVLGWLIPPFIIVKAQNHLAPWYTTDELPSDFTEGRRTGRYCLLILDGHGSHHTAQFEEFCREKEIITACMPPHSSHLLQPLDVGCFGPLKTAYGQQFESQMRLGIDHVDKEDFFRLYLTAHVQALTPANIKSGFGATGLVPYDPEWVPSSLALARTPSPALSGSTYMVTLTISPSN
jgi:hypothetical protein